MDNGEFMVDADLHTILDILHQKKPLRVEDTESRLAKMLRKPARYLLWCSALSCVALGLLTVLARWFDLFAHCRESAALVLFIVSAGAGLSWMIVDIVPDVVDMFIYKDDFHRTRKLALVHDLHQAKDLHRFEIAALKLTDHWLSLRIERMRLHLGLLIGGSDKVAVLALIVGAWGIWTSFPASGVTVAHYGYVVVGAAICGLAVGGLLANLVIKELSYQRDLLSLALSTAPSDTQASAPTRQ